MRRLHWHRWRVVAAQPCVETGNGGQTNGTNVLRYCGVCGRTRSDWLLGVWSVRELRGGDPQ